MEPQRQLSPATELLLKPPGFELDDWKVFRTACQETAELLSLRLGRLVGDEVEFEVAEFTAGPASDLVAGIRSGTRMIATADGWDASIMFFAPRLSAYVAADRLLGGTGSTDGIDPAQPVGRFEVTSAGFVFLNLIDAIEQGMPANVSPRLQAGVVEATLSLDSLCSPSEPAVAVRFSSTARDLPLELTMLLMQRTLLNIGEPLKGSLGEAEAGIDPKWHDHFEQQVRNTDLALSAAMDGGVLTLGQLSRLQAGQLLELPVGPDSLVTVRCNGESLLRCKLGQSEGAFMLRVEQTADRGKDIVEHLLATNGIGM